MTIYYVDGKFLPADQAMIPVDDLAVIRGIGVFDLLRTYRGKPYFLQEHVSRLFHSARKVKLELPWAHAEVCALVLETLARNDLDHEANIRVIVTGGSSPDFLTPSGKPRLLILVTPLPSLPEQWYTMGVKVITRKVQRDNPAAKSINYLPAALALRDAQAQGAVEVIYLDENDNALEGTTSNLFALVEGTLVTPGRGILSGITRQVVLQIAAPHYTVEIRDLPIQTLRDAQEVFITGTNKGLVPVIQVDDARIGEGRPGPAACHLMTLLESHMADLSDQDRHKP
jgi:branched-chain amino acid aminotransferase